MWGSIATAVIGWIAKGLALFGIYLAGEKAQQAKDEQAIVSDAKVRAQVDEAANQLSDQQLRDSLRAGKQ